MVILVECRYLYFSKYLPKFLNNQMSPYYYWKDLGFNGIYPFVLTIPLLSNKLL